ncbi:MAG: Spy/CpxP family protein refolding chaperone [Gemmatimonadota bacterium]
MIDRRITIAALPLFLSLLLTAPADAQHRGMGQQQPGQQSGQMMPGMGMMSGMMGAGMMDQSMLQMMGRGMGLMATGGPGPHMILRMRDVLDLSDEQVGDLEAIRDRSQGQSMSETVIQTHARAQQALAGENPDFNAYESALRDTMDAMVEMHVEMARATAEAKEVLTEEQRLRLDEIGYGMMGGMMMGPGR